MVKVNDTAIDDVVVAEAAAWIARLQDGGRTAAAEAAFKEWLLADQAHARAFSRATDVWDLVPGAAGAGAVETRRVGPADRRASRMAWAACGVLVVFGVAMTAYLSRTPTYTTAVGQQQTIVLQDGTRVSLNTDSKLRVSYSAQERRLELERGEGLFEVAKDARRPLIVQAGQEQVRALGTTFVVRRDPVAVAVTLIEGEVEVTRGGQSGRASQSDVKPDKPVRLAPGERVIIRADAGVALDRPKVETMTAWRRGEVMFDDVSLLDAVAEINRYGETHVVVADPSLAQLRVSGVFETRDPYEFARAMAQLHKLHVRNAAQEIVLEGVE